MAKKYLSPEEQKEAIEMYSTGKYTFQQVADKYFVSKGTIINACKGYPYNCDKQGVYSRLQLESKANLDDCIANETKRAKEANKRRNMTAYNLHLERLKELYQYQIKDNIYEPLKQHRLQCEQLAWTGLSEGNYIQFATNADMWEILTGCIGDYLKSPFKLVAQDVNARHKSKSVRYSNLELHVALKPRSTSFVDITENSWSMISKALPAHKPPRGQKPTEDKKYMQAVLYSMSNTISLRAAARMYKIDKDGLCRTYKNWYKQGIFNDFLQLVSVCPELEQIQSQLIEMERIRQEKGIVPRMKDLI